MKDSQGTKQIADIYAEKVGIAQGDLTRIIEADFQKIGLEFNDNQFYVNNIKFILVVLGISQREFAKHLKLPNTSLQRRLENPSLWTTEELARAFEYFAKKKNKQ